MCAVIWNSFLSAQIEAFFDKEKTVLKAKDLGKTEVFLRWDKFSKQKSIRTKEMEAMCLRDLTESF